jgi:hypothetical protein
MVTQCLEDAVAVAAEEAEAEAQRSAQNWCISNMESRGITPAMLNIALKELQRITPPQPWGAAASAAIEILLSACVLASAEGSSF